MEAMPTWQRGRIGIEKIEVGNVSQNVYEITPGGAVEWEDVRQLKRKVATSVHRNKGNR